MSFSAQDVAKLREKTGAGMMECKKDLTETNGNIDKAAEILRQKGIIAAAKKAEKSSEEGIVTALVSPDKKSAVMLEINTQTDFVARNDSFLELTKTIANKALENKPKNIDELLKLKVGNETIADLISLSISRIGENIKVRRLEILELKNKNGVIGIYVHPVGNKIGVLVKLEISDNKALSEDLTGIAKDLAIHIAASQPQPEFIDKTEIPKDVIEKEKTIELGKEDLAKKPPDIKEKIVMGRLDKILAQRCLLEQPFIKDQSLTITKYLSEKSKSIGAEIKIAKFVRYNVGEHLEHLGTEGEKSPVGSTKE